MVNEAALGGRRGVEDELVELGGDLMRRGQLRPLHVERRADELWGRIVGASGVGEKVALQRRVHERGGDTPDREDGDNDGSDREDRFHLLGHSFVSRRVLAPRMLHALSIVTSTAYISIRAP
jgi:hypothetical protein